MKNANILWASTFVDALAESGLDAVCIAPGSRSTPLTLAFASHPGIQIYHQIDERSAAFFALGLAIATDRPVALVCTSGTATANFHPAILEAHQALVPLLVLTGDRPHELRHSGANQTVDQIKMFGDHVLWSVDMALPEPEPPDAALLNVMTTACRAYATANGMRKGPVHINFPFRKPLEPASSGEPLFPETPACHTVSISRGHITPSADQIRHVTQLINEHERGLIICGPNCPRDVFPQALLALAIRCGYPIVADPLSGIRFWGGEASELTICSYETFLHERSGAEKPPFSTPDILLCFGAVPTSKWLNLYLSRCPFQHRIHVRENGVWADDSHQTTLFLQANESLVCAALTESIDHCVNRDWAETVFAVEKSVRAHLRSYGRAIDFDAAYLMDMVSLLPDECRLWIGNSLPVRHLDQFGMPSRRKLTVHGNRGASGIDGTISSALGAATADDSPLVLAIGDVTFAHDVNGLALVRQIRSPVTIVLFNNGGGGIFRRLPIARFEPPFTDLYLTPPSMQFAAIAKGFGWHFVAAPDRRGFREQLHRSISDPAPTIIEVKTDSASDYDETRKLTNEIQAAINVLSRGLK